MGTNGADSEVAVNKFGMFFHMVTNIQELKRRVVDFVNALLEILNAYEERRLKIDADKGLSPEGRVRALDSLKKEYMPAFGDMLIRGEGMLSIMCKEFALKVEMASKYAADSNTQIEMLRQIEVRTKLERMPLSDLKGLLFGPQTSDLVFYSIYCAPFPMLPAEDMELAAESRLKRIAPEVVDFREGVKEAGRNVVGTLERAYHYVGSEAPRKIALNLPSLTNMMINAAYPGDAMKRQTTIK